MASYRAKSNIFNRFMSKALRELPEWETAIEWLMLVTSIARSDGTAYRDDESAATHERTRAQYQ
jgi:hypothetical protein